MKCILRPTNRNDPANFASCDATRPKSARRRIASAATAMRAQQQQHALTAMRAFTAEATGTMSTFLETVKSTAEQMKNSVNTTCASPRSP